MFALIPLYSTRNEASLSESPPVGFNQSLRSRLPPWSRAFRGWHRRVRPQAVPAVTLCGGGMRGTNSSHGLSCPLYLQSVLHSCFPFHARKKRGEEKACHGKKGKNACSTGFNSVENFYSAASVALRVIYFPVSMLWKPYISQAPMNIDPPSSCSKGAKGFFLARRVCSRCCRSGVGTWRRYWTLMFLLRKEKWGASSAPTSKEGRSIKGILSVARAVLTPRESSPPPPRAVSLELPSWKSHEEIVENICQEAFLPSRHLPISVFIR